MNLSFCFRLLTLLSITIVSTACMDIRLVDKENGPDATVAESGPTAERPMAVATGEWNRYHVVVPAALSFGALRKARFDPSTKKTLAASFVPGVAQGSTYVDRDVEPGRIYQYEWGTVDGGVFQSKGQARVAVPLDFEIKGEIVPGDAKAARFFESPRFGRVIFRDGAMLTTEGRHLRIVADEIQFENATIRSFAAGATAAQGKAGRHGGQILIKARRAVGDVRFDLRGESGGEGLPGAKPGTELKGLPGRKGNDAGLVYVGATPGPFSNPIYQCHIQPTDGDRGYPGKPGNPGGVGGAGGDSGELHLEISDRSDLRFETYLEVGRGGSGGAGGEGGEGGDGGKPGVSRAGGQLQGCQSANEGAKGDSGPRGPQGYPGAAGVLKRVCLIDGDRRNCE